MLNVLSEYQTLIQIKRSEKVHYIESAQWCTNELSVTLTVGPFYMSYFFVESLKESEENFITELLRH